MPEKPTLRTKQAIQARIPRHRHRHREDVGRDVGVDVGDVECGLYRTSFIVRSGADNSQLNLPHCTITEN